MSATENRTISIFIDDKGLEDKLTSYNKKYEKLNREIQKLEPGTDAYIKKAAEMEKVKKLIDQTEGQLSGKLGPTLRQLQDQQRKLNLELSQMPVELRKSSEAAAKLNLVNQKIAEVKAETNQTTVAMKKLNAEKQSMIGAAVNGFGKAADAFNRYAGAIVAGIAAFAGLMFSFRKAIDAANEYESALAELSSLTGLVGKDLQWLSKQAIEMSTSTIEGNIRITKSAKDIVDAYKIVGSQRPELLKNKDALNEVTKQALILAEAAKIDLVEAVKGVTTTLNQFDAAASESSRIVNVLAAGSKEGAGDVGYIQVALEKSGTAANMANIPIEQTVGLIETLAPRFSEASVAGTNLKNVLLKMESGAKDTRPSVVGLDQALENLAKQNLSAKELTERFGQENVNAAAILIRYRDEVKQYTKAITGTSVALEQAAINTNTAEAKLAQHRNEIQKNTIILGQALTPALAGVTGLWSKFVGVLADFVSIPLSEKMEQERIDLQKTHATLISTNVSQEQRIKLIKELQQKYPEYLGNLDAETVSNEELSKAIKKVNDQLINKIILQKKDEEIESQNEEVAKRKMRAFELEDKLRTNLVKAAEQYGITLKENVSLEEQAAALLEEAQKRRDVYEGVGSTYNRVRMDLNNYVGALQIVNQAEGVNNKLLEERQKLMQKLGIKEETAPTDTTVKTKVKQDTPQGEDELTKEEKAAKKLAEKRIKEKQKELDRLYKLQVDHYDELFKEALKFGDKELAELIKSTRTKLDEIKDFYSKEAEAVLDYNVLIAATDEERYQAEVTRIKQHYSDKMVALEEGSYQYKLLQEQMNNELEQLNDNYYSSQLQNAQNYIDQTLAVGNQFMNALSRRNNRELQMIATKNEQEKQMLKQQLDNKIITQEMYDAKVAALDRRSLEQETEIRQKEAQQQKIAALFEAGIKILLAWIEAYINPTKMPQAIAASAQGALLAAMEIPEFYDGGFLPKTADDRQPFPIIAHGNEYMIPARELRDPVVASFADMIETSRRGGPSVTNQMQNMQPQPAQQQVIVQQNDATTQVLERLLNVLEQGVKSEVLFDDERLFRLQENMNKQKVRDNEISF